MAESWRQLLAGHVASLYTHDLGTGRSSLVYQTAEAVLEAPNWSVDGQWLIFNREGLLYQLAADGSAPPSLIATGDIDDANNDHVLSPDGRYLYLSAGDGHLYEVALTGGTPRRVSNEHGHAFLYYLHGISPDGSVLAYTGAQEVGGDPHGSLNIFTVPVAGGDDFQVTRSGKPDDGPEYSPDGEWLYFNSEMGSTASGHAQLFRVHPDGSGAQQLTDDERVNWFPHLSPDGARLLYLSYPPGTIGHPADRDVILRLTGPEGGTGSDVLDLFGGQGTINVNSWAPDSRRFAYVAYGPA